MDRRPAGNDQDMSEYEVTRDMPAGSGAVFDVASDVERLDRWMPHGMDVRPTGGDSVHVSSEEGGHHEVDGLFRAEREQLRVEWANRGTDAYSGWLQIADQDGGSSDATLHLSFSAHGHAEHGLKRAEIERSMTDALDRLADLAGGAA